MPSEPHALFANMSGPTERGGITRQAIAMAANVHERSGPGELFMLISLHAYMFGSIHSR